MIDALRTGLARFSDGLDSCEPVLTLQKEWSDVLDAIVCESFSRSGKGLKMAVFALGGYGRREMSPYSDIDLMFLYEDDMTAVRKVVDAVLYPFWDSKFEAGGATRTIDDCINMFGGDIRAQTAMLDARLVAGDDELAGRFFGIVTSKLDDPRWKKRFARAKYDEQVSRFRRFGGSVYMLEPHIKESEGGLREFQTAQWINRVKNGVVPSGVPEEVSFLFKLRAHLHLIAGKREDRLTFDNQKALSAKLCTTPDSLMSEYYRSTSIIHAAARPVTEAASPFLRRVLTNWRMERIKKMVGSRPSWQRLVANRDVLYDALLMMHETGELKELIPSFGGIYFRTQYGAYHVYTVDIHSILTVKRMLELEKDKGHPLLCSVYKKIRNKDILFLAALLHDIGKDGRVDMSHSRRGAEMALNEAQRLGYSIEDAEKVSFLVDSHLIMPRLAFSRDLADPLLIENFAGSVGSADKLDMLFVLSYADIASIGPDVWTPWKEKLLSELYLAAKRLFSGAKKDQRDIHRMKQRAEMEGDAHSKIWFSSMPERYFRANSPKDILAHIEMFKGFTTQPVITRHIKRGNYSEFIIMTGDAPGIFAKIAGAMSANNVSIMDAELNTGKNGIVLDILRVTGEGGGPVPETVAFRVIRSLEDVLSGRKDVEELVKKRSVIFRRRGTQIEPRVVIDNDVSVYYTVVDIFAKDRVGLLYDLSNVIFKEGCTIDVAKILTNADMAKDSFYIKSADGRKISSAEKLETIKRAILEVL